MLAEKIDVFFHHDQLKHKPMYEWAFGEKLEHPETTTRADNILASLVQEKSLFDIHQPARIPLQLLRQTHNSKLITMYRTAMDLEKEVTFYPSVFPKRNQTVGDPRNIQHAGYFCFDSGTPLNSTTWMAAAWSAACANDAAKLIESGKRKLAYSLCRPPGHHAMKDLFGGYCYFNNAALVAKRLRKKGRVAVIDIDFHHGNGTQALFYRDSHVLFLSIHGDPKEFYPFYWGFANEKGLGRGEGFNINIPLPKGCDGQEYLKVLREKAVPQIQAFNPASLVISAGFDTYKEDPIGKFSLETADYHPIGAALGRMCLPTVVVQEGGYCTARLGDNVATFLRGVRDGSLTTSTETKPIAHS